MFALTIGHPTIHSTHPECDGVATLPTYVIGGGAESQIRGIQTHLSGYRGVIIEAPRPRYTTTCQVSVVGFQGVSTG